jgi:uncharacterized protein (TIGR03067 family)
MKASLWLFGFTALALGLGHMMAGYAAEKEAALSEIRVKNPGTLPDRWSVFNWDSDEGGGTMLVGLGVDWVVKDKTLSLPVFKDDKVLSGPNGRTFTYTLDAGYKPYRIDLVGQTGADKGKMFLGIYMLDAKTRSLRICFSPPGQERPTEFKTERGSGRILIELK